MLYSPSHTWVSLKGEEATIGITQQFGEELDEIVYIELPKVRHTILEGDEVAVLESTKAAIDLTSPLSGTITSVNEALNSDPGLLKKSPEKEGWILKIKINTPAEIDTLIDFDEYQKMFTTC